MAPTHIKRFVAFREKEKLYHYALVPTVSSLFKEPHMRSYTYFGSVGILYSFFFFSLSLLGLLSSILHRSRSPVLLLCACIHFIAISTH